MKIRRRPQGARVTSRSTLRGAIRGGIGLLLVGCGPQAPQEQPPVGLDDDASRASYGVGYNVADNVKGQFAAFLNEEAFIAGIQDGIAGLEQRVADPDIATALAGLQGQRDEGHDTDAAENLARGQLFLEQNAGREQVVTLASGLQYEVLVEGAGPKPLATDTVKTHYHGTLPDGTVFDSSVESDAPASFPVRGVIPGWVEALQLMPVGSKWRLYVPSELAYGDRGAGARIGPNQVLIFEVELLEIESS